MKSSSYKKVLILGNGLSRLLFKDYIKAWKHEIWVCNFAYKEFPKADRLAGHDWVLAEAEKAGFKGKLMWGNLGKGQEGWTKYKCPQRFHLDSGFSLVAEALYRGYDVKVCGFDLGGADIHSPEHWKQNKFKWPLRWAELFRYFGSDKIEFIGVDHKPYIYKIIAGLAKGTELSDLYTQGVDHLDLPGYEELLREHGVEKGNSRKMIEVIETGTGKKIKMRENIAVVMQERGQVVIKKRRPEEKSHKTPDARS